VASNPHSEPSDPTGSEDATRDIRRPSDHFDSAAPDPGIVQPRLGLVGYLRFFWRQLTSMRTALFLLLLLAFAAVPGSLVPQRTADPNGVVQFARDNPGLYQVLDTLQVFSTYSSVWFSAIYLLLFVSLVGCVIPRAKHHWDALRARPPRTPARLERMGSYQTSSLGADASTDSATGALDSAEALLKRSGYRVERFADSVSAERGYARETGNLVFHLSLVGILIAVGIGGGVGYTGQRIVPVGSKFVNTQGDFDSMNPGPYVDPESITPYRIVLDDFTVDYAHTGTVTDYTKKDTIRVNEPLDIGGTQVYLLGNGYAPIVTVRDPQGAVVLSEPVPFLPQDGQMTSQGIIKIADGLDEQLGLQGFFYPTPVQLDTGAYASVFPDLDDPMLSLQVFSGDLGIDAGVPKSVYTLDTAGMTKLAGRDAPLPALQLRQGETAQLPNGLGSVELSGVVRYASLEVHHDPTQLWVLGFAILVVAGLLSGLFIPRRRVWVRARTTDDGTVLEYAGLARGEDPALETAVTDIRRRHAQQLGIKVDS
jgi:cytochrome c biogenesis protein